MCAERGGAEDLGQMVVYPAGHAGRACGIETRKVEIDFLAVGMMSWDHKMSLDLRREF